MWLRKFTWQLAYSTCTEVTQSQMWSLNSLPFHSPLEKKAWNWATHIRLLCWLELWFSSTVWLLSTYREIWKISLLKYFSSPVDYEIKYHEIFSTLKFWNGEILEYVRMRKRTLEHACRAFMHYRAVRVFKSRSRPCCLPLSVLLSTALRLISMDAH